MMEATYARQRDRVLVALRGGAQVAIDARGGEMMADVLDHDSCRLWQVCATVLGRMQREGILLRTEDNRRRGCFDWLLTNRGKEMAAALPVAPEAAPPALRPLTFDEVEQVGRFIAYETLPPFAGDPKREPQPRDQIGRLVLEWRVFKNLAENTPDLATRFSAAIAAQGVVEEQFGSAWRALQQRGSEP